jgi:hypothetical protein
MKLRTEGQQAQHGRRGKLLDQETEQLDGRGIGPVQVLPYGEDGLLPGLLDEPRDQGIEGLLPLLVRRQSQGCVLAGRVEAEEGGQERDRLLEREDVNSQKALELDEFLSGPFAWLERQTPFKVVHDWIEGAVGMVGRAAKRPVRTPVRGGLFAHHLDQARLANAPLATQEYRVARSGHAERPPPTQERHLILAPHERAQAPSGPHVEAGMTLGVGDNSVEGPGLGHALERMRTQLVDREVPLHESMGRCADHDGVGGCQPLDA